MVHYEFSPKIFRVFIFKTLKIFYSLVTENHQQKAGGDLQQTNEHGNDVGILLDSHPGQKVNGVGQYDVNSAELLCHEKNVDYDQWFPDLWYLQGLDARLKLALDSLQQTGRARLLLLDEVAIVVVVVDGSLDVDGVDGVGNFDSRYAALVGVFEVVVADHGVEFVSEALVFLVETSQPQKGRFGLLLAVFAEQPARTFRQ